MKERLTGAIILVALIVLLVPELLTGPIRTKSAPAASSTVGSPSVTPPARAQPPLRSYTLTLGAAPQGQDAAPTPAATVPVQPPGSSAQGPGQTPAQGPEAADGPQHAVAPAASRPKASSLPRQSTRDGAGLQVAKSPTHPSVREARSSASSTGWIVQLGSFASRQNADRLAHSLARRGFRMSVAPARAGSRVLWRVRAGPAHDRAGAQHLAAKLRALGHRGELLPVR